MTDQEIADQALMAGRPEFSAVHYGPVWSKPRKSGDSFAACANDEDHGTLTTHWPWVTCPACKALSPSSSEGVKRDQ